MALDAGSYTLSVPDRVATAADFTGAGTSLAAAGPGAGDCWILCGEDLDVIEVGCFITVTTGADTFAFTFNKRQTMGGSDILLATVTGPAGAAVAIDRILKRRRGDHTAILDSIQWTFEKGDLMHFIVTDASAAGGAGVFYAKCYPTGGQKIASKMIGTTFTTVDIVSTT